MAKINLIKSYGDCRYFRIEDERGYCEFSVWKDARSLGSFGGSLWPSSFPDVFEHVGPDKFISHRSGPALRAGIELPAA